MRRPASQPVRYHHPQWHLPVKLIEPYESFELVCHTSWLPFSQCPGEMGCSRPQLAGYTRPSTTLPKGLTLVAWYPCLGLTRTLCETTGMGIVDDDQPWPTLRACEKSRGKDEGEEPAEGGPIVKLGGVSLGSLCHGQVWIS